MIYLQIVLWSAEIAMITALVVFAWKNLRESHRGR